MNKNIYTNTGSEFCLVHIYLSTRTMSILNTNLGDLGPTQKKTHTHKHKKQKTQMIRENGFVHVFV